jgi:predicted DNA-binding transcriptional regulator AlpA
MIANDSAGRLLDERQAADFLNINHRTLQAWRLRGGGPRFVKVGRLVRYRTRDLNDWIDGRAVDSTSAAGGQ